MAHRHPAQPSNEPSTQAAAHMRELREKVKRYELIFKATNDVLYDIDLTDGSVDWNEALYAQYGYTRREPTNSMEWWASHVHPEDALLIENKLANVAEQETGTWQCDYRFKRADGRYNYVRDRGVLVRNESGEPTRIIGSLLDMTAQKQLDIAKDEFVSLVSHQLRTPLTVIRVYGEMLTSGTFGDLSAEQTQWIRNMTNSSARLIDVVGDILNVSRLDLGRINITPRPVNLRSIVEACIRDVQPIADDKKVSIHLKAPVTLPEVPIDEAIFVQIVHNLLTNGIRYTHSIVGKVTVGLATRKDGYVISVKDNGIGIPKDAEEHIFERFYRAKNAQSLDAQGSGLGLYLIQVMCEAFGGKVWFKTTNAGTTFYVQIPKTGMVAIP